MRDPKRIYEFCNELACVWSKMPDLRFTQLICNIFGDNPNFYQEDDKSLEQLKNYINSTKYYN